MTVVSFSAFIAILVWALSGKRNSAFAQAARLPFEEDGVMAPESGACND
jgi:cbb3-type cytochrome oxidase subunit 3